jgi:peptidoglycan LD-endopeptidase CwlK
MSAGSDAPAPLISRDMTLLAPRFREAVENALAECQTKNLDAFVYEGFRSEELQQHYFARGRTIIPPNKTVTNAPGNLYSWHGYGLAVDIISRSKGWDAGEKWFHDVAKILKSYRLSWGGDWVVRDPPHFQWGFCKPSPSDRARELFASGGAEAVWRAVNAD